MAKFVFVAVLLLAAVAMSTAAPAEGFDNPKVAEENSIFDGQEEHLRLRRALCEYNAQGGAYWDNGCISSCSAMGRAHGTCSNGVCQCSEIRTKDVAVRLGG